MVFKFYSAISLRNFFGVVFYNNRKETSKKFFLNFFISWMNLVAQIFFSYFSLNKSRNVFIEEELLIWLDYTETATTYTQFFFLHECKLQNLGPFPLFFLPTKKNCVMIFLGINRIEI